MISFNFKKYTTVENKKNWRKTKHYYSYLRGYKQALTIQKQENVNSHWYNHCFYGPAYCEYHYKNRTKTETYFLLSKEFHEYQWRDARKTIQGFSAAIDRKLNPKKNK
jgi:predicted ATP-binding protein involved in virulence